MNGSAKGYAVVLLAVCFIALCCAKPSLKDRNKKEDRNRPIHRRLRPEHRDKLKKHCFDDLGNNKCREQKDKFKRRRATVKKALLELTAFQNGIEESDAEELVERRLRKIQDLKRAWHRRNEIEEIEPADDGFWGGDIILTEDQADEIAKHLETVADEVYPGLPGPRRRKRSAAIFFETNTILKWPMPIHFWISSQFTSTQKTTIRSALAAITAAAPCIKFYEDKTALTVGFQVQYRLMQDDYCGGFSLLGRVGIQSININLNACWSTAVGKRVTMHETIHALGGDHEQSRVDRDTYLDIVFENIDPQDVDQYDKALGSSNYGVEYDYDSIMHYQNGAFAIDPAKPTMIPLFQAPEDFGGDVLSAGDKLQLNRMYCRPASCVDTDVACGVWATDDWCDDTTWGNWMKTNCGKSCGAC